MNQINPLISVVVPIYNRSHLIKNTINSILNQSYQNFEIILIDDFSQDVNQLKSIITEINDERINLLFHTENKHGAAARNTGIIAAQGHYVAFLDSDDVWNSEKLELCLNYNIKSHQVLYSKFKNQGHYYPKRAKQNLESVGDYLLVNAQAMQTSTLFMQTSIAKQVMFDQSLVRFQDYDFTIRLEHHGAEFIFIDAPIVSMLDDDKGSRISNSVNAEPAIFWLDKIAPLISLEAKKSFYINRVVRLLIISGHKDQIYKMMTLDIFKALSTIQKFKLLAFRLLPNRFWALIRTIYKWKNN